MNVENFKIDESKNYSSNFSGKLIAKNTVYNLLGYGVPLVFALVLIPPLISKLGTERFGVLNLIWIVVGYFSFFDFGFGKGLTKVIAEKIGLNQTEQISKIFWTTILIMIFIGLVTVLILFFFVGQIVNIVNVSNAIHQETLNTFYVLILAIPIISTTAGLRGVLEAYQKFAEINIIRVSLGISTFLGPLLVLIITNSLFWVVVFLIFIRLLIWVTYLLLCFKVNEDIRKKITFDVNSIRPVLKFSIWITIINIIGPIILYSDRLLIAALISAEAIAYYATPFEVVTKLLLIPTSLIVVLFPIFSSSYLNNPELAKKILLRGAKLIFLILYPIVFLMITFAYNGMNLWLGEKFAINSSLVLQFLSIGILMNSISMIPNNYFQGIGKPKIPTIINLIELPVYISIMWFSIDIGGIKGAALAYMVMATMDAFIMYAVANRIVGVSFNSDLGAFSFIIMMLILVCPFFIDTLVIKLIFGVSVLATYAVMLLNFFLSVEEKSFILARLKMQNSQVNN